LILLVIMARITPSARVEARDEAAPVAARTTESTCPSATDRGATAVAQVVAAAIEPAAERVLAAAELRRRFHVRPAFEIAQDERHAVALRQALQFLVEHAAQVAQGHVLGRVRGRHGGDLLFAGAAAGAVSLGPDRDPVGDFAQPPRDRLAAADRIRLASEDQECGLEGVFRVLLVAEDGATNGQDHGPVPADEVGERRLVAGRGEAVEEFRVRREGPRADVQPAQVLEDQARLRAGHGRGSYPG
jgi:hypothetical protein